MSTLPDALVFGLGTFVGVLLGAVVCYRVMRSGLSDALDVSYRLGREDYRRVHRCTPQSFATQPPVKPSRRGW